MPQDTWPPGMFVGRIPELEAFESCLFQTLNGSPSHILIEGERGIGKSSLLLFMEALAKGEFKGLNYDGLFNFLCVSTDLSGCDYELQIIQKITRQLQAQLKRIADPKELVKSFLQWSSNWEVMGVRFHKTPPDNIDPDVALQDLVFHLSALCKDKSLIDGVVILLDEADAPPASAGLGRIMKMFQERMTKENCRNVMFCMAGLPKVIANMSESHPSSPRLFHIYKMETLTPDERDRVIELGLNRANEVNPIKVEIDSDALDIVRDMSEGYPHFLQQFAHSAFEENNDEVIDVGDVLEGAYKENGAFDQLGQKFFAEKYNILISSDDYRTVLHTMAQFSDNWVKKIDIEKLSNLSKHTVGNALKALKAKEIVIHDTTRQGFYRLPTQSFAVWVNAAKRRRRETVNAELALERSKQRE